VKRSQSTRRRLIAAGLALVCMAGVAQAGAPSLPDDMALGSPRAPVTVVEYASLGCPHCGAWSRDVFPAFKKTYIDTGKVRFVLREMLFGDSTLAAAGFMAARCAGAAKYFQVVEGVFTNQVQIENGGVAELLKVAQAAGMTEDRFKTCLQDQAARQAFEARANRYVTVDKITGTPTFVVGDRTLEGEQSLADLGAAIASARHR
jgi:protein-disulfide isomerase